MDTASASDRRLHERVPGPFDARRVDALETPLRIYNLSEGGCFINSLLDQQPGVAFRLEIELPDAGKIQLKAETIYRNEGVGFAVRFVGMTEEATTHLRLALQQIRNLSSS